MGITEVQFGKDRYHQINDMADWCYEHFGSGGQLARPDDKWALDMAFGNSFFKFKNEKDAIMFILRWKQ